MLLTFSLRFIFTENIKAIHFKLGINVNCHMRTPMQMIFNLREVITLFRRAGKLTQIAIFA
jgi:hypothetical protein